MKKFKRGLSFTILIDNWKGEVDSKSDKIYPVTTIFRKYQNKEDDIHKDIVFYSNGDVEFMENVSMCRYTQIDQFPYNFIEDTTMLHYLSILNIITDYNNKFTTDMEQNYREYLEGKMHAKLNDIQFIESTEEFSPRYTIIYNGDLTGSVIVDKDAKYNRRNIFEDKPILNLQFCSENGDKIYAFIFRDGRVVFGGSGPYKLSRLQFRFLIEVVHKICKVSYQNIEKYFEDVDEAYEKILTDICLVNNNLFGGV